MSEPASTPQPYQPAGLLRRLAAAVYDALLWLAIVFVATALLLPFTGGAPIAPGNPLYSSYLLFVSFFFFGWFWVHGGQTLGMRAWRLRVQQRDGRPITWWHALLRFLAAIVSWGCAGLGLLWILVDREKMAWHDRFSESVVVRVPKDYLR